MIKFENFIPPALANAKGWSDLFSYLKEWYEKIINASDLVKNSYNGLNRNVSSLQALSEQEGSYSLAMDDSRTKRKIIYYSRKIQRCPYCFSVWKPVIDLITGGDCQLYYGQYRVMPFIVEQSNVEGLDTLEDLGYTEGNPNNRIETDFVVESSIIGSEFVYDYKYKADQVNGDVFIDLNMVSTPSSNIAQTVAKYMAPLSTSIFRIYLGYTFKTEFIVLTSLRA